MNDEPANNLGGNGPDDDHKGGNDDVREEHQEYLLEEEGYTCEAENLKRRNQKYENDKPLNNRSQEFPDVEIKAGSMSSFSKTGCLQCLIDAKRLHYLNHNVIERNSDDPTNNKPNDCGERFRQYFTHRVPESPKRSLYRS